ncbi:MAG: M13 family metallopeptidase N-terminal domain-containing protein, partial [Chitinophagaceae bacterium]
MKRSLSLFITLLSFAACKNTADKNAAHIQGIDSSLKPGNNFFMYVNRIWYDSAQIPPSQAGVGAYMFMNYPQRLRLQGILDSVSKAANTAGTIEQKLGDFYGSGMDTVTINKRGYDPIRPILASIDSIRDVASLMTFVANEAKVNNSSLMAFGVGADNKNSNLNIAH